MPRTKKKKKKFKSCQSVFRNHKLSSCDCHFKLFDGHILPKWLDAILLSLRRPILDFSFLFTLALFFAKLVIILALLLAECGWSRVLSHLNQNQKQTWCHGTHRASHEIRERGEWARGRKKQKPSLQKGASQAQVSRRGHLRREVPGALLYNLTQVTPTHGYPLIQNTGLEKK